MDTKQCFGVYPCFAGRESRLSAQGLKLGNVIFMGIFRVNAFTFIELEGISIHAHGLLGAAFEEYLDAARIGIVLGDMPKALQVESAPDLAIDTAQ